MNCPTCHGAGCDKCAGSGIFPKTYLTDDQRARFVVAAVALWKATRPNYGGNTDTWNYLTADYNAGDPLSPILEAAGIDLPRKLTDEEAEYLGQECWDLLGDYWPNEEWDQFDDEKTVL